MRIFSAIALLVLFSCTGNKPEKQDNLARAKAILATTPIIDTHVDFPYRLVELKKWYTPGYTALTIKNPEGDFDLERAKAGGLSAPFMSIYIPSQLQLHPGRSREVADSLINMVYAIVKDYPDNFALALRADDVERNFKKGLLSLPMGMENGSPITKIEDVAYFHDRGIRYVTLTHAKDNQICDSSYDTLHTNNGLSEFGREVVKEMNRVGIMVDVSHLSDKSIADVVQIATKPLIATHSGCRYFTPGFERNLSDTLIKAVAKTNGVIQVPCSQYFLDGKAHDAWHRADSIREALKIPEFGVRTDSFYQSFGNANGEPFWLTVSKVADHIDYLKKLVGIDHIGIGSDFDGVGAAVLPDMKDVSQYPVLIAELLRRGYSDADIRKICSENTLRVWRANE